ncbi:hypothetical protein SDC9_123671 [bioreactor metagenome]|uniref:Uncharacterized protein n=1 Tax=bioreactor metagenome TaxID=1076179 RepID=A0A645CIR5_9ZZZZ
MIGLELLGVSALETAFGATFIFLSLAVLSYGSYEILTRQEKEVHTNKIWTVYEVLTGSEKEVHTDKIWTLEDYIEELNIHRKLKTFEKTIDLLFGQIERLQKKNKTIRRNLLQIFNASEMSYKKFDEVIAEVEKIFFLNIRSILNKLDTFDEEDFNSSRKKYEEGTISPEIYKEKSEVFNEYINFVKAAAEDNEQILLKLDKLLLEISGLNSIESGQLEQMAGMIEIDNLIKQAKYYKN